MMLLELELLQIVLAFSAAASLVMQYLVNQKAGRYSKSRFCLRVKPLPTVFGVLAIAATYMVGRIEMRAKQAEVDRQQATLTEINKNIESLVEQGKLSRRDAQRIFLKDVEDSLKPQENLDRKVIRPSQK